jgi:hypothetical protein
MAGAMMLALDVILISRAVKHMDRSTFSVGYYFVAAALSLVIRVLLRQPQAELARGW